MRRYRCAPVLTRTAGQEKSVSFLARYGGEIPKPIVFAFHRQLARVGSEAYPYWRPSFRKTDGEVEIGQSFDFLALAKDSPGAIIDLLSPLQDTLEIMATLLILCNQQNGNSERRGHVSRKFVDMLAHVLGRAIGTAEQLAAYADSARIAGLTCERTYDGVRALPGVGKGEVFSTYGFSRAQARLEHE